MNFWNQEENFTNITDPPIFKDSKNSLISLEREHHSITLKAPNIPCLKITCLLLGEACQGVCEGAGSFPPCSGAWGSKGLLESKGLSYHLGYQWSHTDFLTPHCSTTSSQFIKHSLSWGQDFSHGVALFRLNHLIITILEKLLEQQKKPITPAKDLQS